MYEVRMRKIGKQLVRVENTLLSSSNLLSLIEISLLSIFRYRCPIKKLRLVCTENSMPPCTAPFSLVGIESILSVSETNNAAV